MLSILVPFLVVFEPNKQPEVNLKTATTYQFVSVDGPIQPIPYLSQIDNDWRELGSALFHSPLLSQDNTVSCATCHMVNFGGDDGFPVSTGVNNLQGQRNSPSVLNAVFNFRQFWDGRSADLAEQAIGPIHNPVEMASSWAQIIPKLEADQYFAHQFSRLNPSGITPEAIVKAIVTFEESLITPDSAIDRYVKGDRSALTEQQKRGLRLFKDYGCSTCHQGVNIGGNIYQKFGRLDDVPESLSQDLGRYLVTSSEIDKHVFKVPSLRNVELTAPYFHEGSIATLQQAVEIMAKSQLGRELTPSEIDDLVALLASFTGELSKGKTP